MQTGSFSLSLSLSLSFALGVARPSSAQGTTHRLLDELQAVHAHSVPGPMVSTPDGATLFVAEAGVLAVIDAEQASSYVEPIKIFPISSHGVRAVELLLDPAANLVEEPDGDNSILYVAGGRLGLWAMRADPRTGEPMPAARIDDASAEGIQDSKRWCNDVDIMVHNNVPYLVALFAEFECSRLRVYPLAAVRAVLNANPGEETSHELWPTVEVPLGGNCQFETPRIESFGFGLAVDGTTVYAAMGPYGLVRVRFMYSGNVQLFEKRDGPWFGDGSFYANSVSALYDDFEYRGGTPPGVLRSDPPYFMDVAVQASGTTRFVWAVVDHLGLVRFNVTNPNAWTTSMPIAHQEGVFVPGTSQTDDAIRLVAQATTEEPGENEEDDDVVIRNYAHRLRIVKHDNPGDTPDVHALVVTAHNTSFILSDSLLDEGRVLGYLGDGYAGIPGATPGPLVSGDDNYTLIYNLASLVPKPPATVPPAATQHVRFLRDGGRHLHLPTAPPLLEIGGTSYAQLILFGGRHEADRGQYTTFRDRLRWDAATVFEHRERLVQHRPGRWIYDISSSPTNPDVLYTGANDAGVYHDGVLVTCDAEIRRFYQGGNDDRAAMGVVFNPVSIWQGPGHGGAPTDFLLGAGKGANLPPPQEDKSAWMLVHFKPSEYLCIPEPSNEPVQLKRIYVLSPPDAFGFIGRMHYLGGVVDEAYDAHVLASEGPGEQLAFVNRSGSPGGIAVLLRQPLESLIVSGGVSDGANFDPRFTTPASYKRDLITHPEFAHIYTQMPAPVDYLQTHDLVGSVLTFLPRLLQLPAPSAAPENEHWVLAVPSGAVFYPPGVPDQPDPVFVSNHTHSMVRVFDVHEHDALTNPTGVVPAHTLIGPHEESAAFRVEPLFWEGRHYLFVANTKASVQVWDLTDLLDQPIESKILPTSQFFVEDWLAPESVSDELPNNLSGLAIDHVQWSTPQGPRDEVYVYVAVSRVGIEVLRFMPGNSPGQRLQFVRRIELPSGMAGLSIRKRPISDERTLLVGDSQAGIRTFGYGE